MLTNLKSSPPVLVMICSNSLPICNHFHSTPCPVKNIPNIIDCHLKKGYPILMPFGTIISGTAGHQMTV